MKINNIFMFLSGTAYITFAVLNIFHNNVFIKVTVLIAMIINVVGFIIASFYIEELKNDIKRRTKNANKKCD